MLLFPNSSRPNQRLKNTISGCMTIVIPIIRIFGYMSLFFGWLVLLFDTKSFKEYQCYVNSTQLIKGNGNVHFRWNITVLNKNPKLDNVFITSVFMSEEESTSSEMQRFKINQTYPCYGPSKAIILLPWQWNKPSPSKAYYLFFFGLLLGFVAIILQKFRQCCEPELTNTQEHQPRTWLTTRNRQQPIAPFHNPHPEEASLESPPPEYTPPESLPPETPPPEWTPPESFPVERPPPSYEVAAQKLLETQIII